MIIVLCVLTLLLALCVVVLFAMLGELNARVQRAGGGGEQDLWQNEQAALGAIAHSWPAELGAARGGQSLILVLSATCASCASVADELRALSPRAAVSGVVLAARDETQARAFLTDHKLADMPIFVDPSGAWVASQFQVRSSPCALIFEADVLVAAFDFLSVTAVLREISQSTRRDPAWPSPKQHQVRVSDAADSSAP